jgi:cytochrome c biogenesis protein CcdA
LLHTAIVVLLIGLGDSLSPTILGGAMYLATVSHPRRAIAEFMIGVLAVNVLAGLLIVLGPGELLLAIVPKPKPLTKHIIELVAGACLISLAVGLWSGRRTLGRSTPPGFTGRGRSGLALGAGVAAVELPTALPYFAAIAVIVGSGAALVGKVVLLGVYNIAFVVPVAGILVSLVVLGDAATQPLARANRWVLAHWPHVLAALAMVLGTVVALLGVIGLLG